jgi:RHS repeat-associated protein
MIVLAADIFQDVGGTGSITSATWNGGAFTKASSTRTGTKSAEMWYLVATTTGAKTMSVTVTGTTDAIKLMSASFNGVHQSSPLDADNTAGGSSGNPSASVTTATANDVVVATLNRHSTTDATTSQTSLYKDRATSTLGAASYQLASSAGSYTDTYTGSASQNWAMVIAGFKPVTASGGSTTLRFLHPDHLGGTNVVTDEDGLMDQAIDYYPYGSKRIEAGTDVSQREFIGDMFDETPDLSYLNARYYKNARGQFLSQDPVFINLSKLDVQLVDPQSWNSYTYARNNSIILKDSGGKWCGNIRILGISRQGIYWRLSIR